MARLLIGWEFGANRGHAVRLVQLASKLREAGHEVDFAVQQLDSIASEAAGGAGVWQAPLTPRLLVTTARPPSRSPVSMADILARLGFDDSGIVESVVRGWRRLLGAVRPDAVIAEYAPFLLLAARGRVPAVALGTGFLTPPPGMAAFPRLAPGEAASDEAATLAAVNCALGRLGDAPLEALPRLFAADRAVVETFAELDPYADDRVEPLAHPVEAAGTLAAGEGEELFVYAPATVAAGSRLWRGLAAAGLPVRVHVPEAPEPLREELKGLGFAVEPEPLPPREIASRARLLVSHGGHGFVCAGLAIGLPHIVCYPDLEKRFHGFALARHGLGGHVSLAQLDPKAFGASLKRIHGDEALAARSLAAGADFRSRPQPPMAETVAQAVADLI